MICANCGTENREGRRFCSECAAPLAVVCPSCGAANQPGEKFCGECASPLTDARRAAGEAPPAPAPRPAAERRIVTVLFADIVGFTPFAEARDAEAVRETLSSYFAAAREVIGRYGGTIEKFIGDAVMAVWGAPIAHEDDPERAIRAGLELVESIRALGAAMELRVGILTGEAAVTLGAVGEGMVAGDLVNTAARLQAVATPGTVLVGEATQRAAGSAIVFESAGAHELKGKAEPVSTWRAVGLASAHARPELEPGLQAPFVGRDAELHLLTELFEATARERRTRLVSVIGPAGIGKSRLAAEFEAQLDRQGGMFWHHGRSPAYGQGITFWALGEMVRRRAGLAETDDEAATRAKVGALVDTYVAEFDRSWVAGALLALLGIEARTVGPDELFGAWRTFFESLAAKGTVVLVFEDLHWADPGLIDFIDHLLEWSKRQPLFILTLARPELLERRADWGAGKREFTSLGLEPLSPAVMRELLGGLVPGLPDRAAKAIIGRADGVPLYAVEMVRMLVGEGKITRSGDTYAPVGDLSVLAVPETLSALIGARLDGLAGPDRALLQDAAVLGQSFSIDSAAAVSGIDTPQLEQRLRALVRRELLTIEVDPRSPERGQYAFVQSMIREVAYNTLARRDRKARHLAAARYFEALGGDELAGVLAGHYLAAYESVPEGPEAEALAGQARIAMRAAAERAAALGSHDQAIDFLTKALSISSDPAEEADLLLRAGQSATFAGHDEQAETLLRRALELRRSLGDPDAVTRAVTALGQAYVNAYRLEPALRLLEDESAAVGEATASEPVIALRAELARAYFIRERSREALDMSDRVLEAAERADLVAIVAGVLVTRGGALCNAGRTYEGLGALEAAEKLASRHGLHFTVLRAIGNRSAYLLDDDPRASLEAARTGLALERRLGRRSAQPYAIGTVGALRTGEWDSMVAELELGLADAPDGHLRTELLADLAGFRAARGEPFGDLLSELVALVGDSAEPYSRAQIVWVRLWDAFADGRLAVARVEVLKSLQIMAEVTAFSAPIAARLALWDRDVDSAGESLSMLDATGRHGRAIEADRRMVQAGIAALEGRRAEALASYRDAGERLRDLGLRWDEALLGIDMVTLLGPDEPEARMAAAASSQILTELRARPFLERLDAAMGGERLTSLASLP